MLAAYVSGNRAHEVPAVMEAMKISSKDSFEIGFNTACGLLAAGDYAKAQSELEHAQRLGKHPSLSSDSSWVCAPYIYRCHAPRKDVPSAILIVRRCVLTISRLIDSR